MKHDAIKLISNALTISMSDIKVLEIRLGTAGLYFIKHLTYFQNFFVLGVRSPRPICPLIDLHLDTEIERISNMIEYQNLRKLNIAN